jgi:1,2-diacylglycerol 3-beta-galactosyltransferase
MSSHPRQWRLFFHLSNTKLNKVFADFHSHRMSGKKIQQRIEEFNPDVVVSVHPTMNRSPQIAARQISKKQGRHIPFVTVVTDLGSAHSMWFQPDVDKLYVASERLQKMAKKKGGTPDENIVLTGLPIRQDFADQKEKLGDRTTEAGKKHQQEIRNELGVDTERQMVLVMGGGEGVGSLSSIVDELYAKLTLQGVDASIYVVCGRNEKLKGQLATRDWDAVVDASKNKKPKKRFGLFRRRRSRKIEEAMKQAEEHMADPHPQGKVTVVGLGFVTNIAEYMASADVLVTKAGPGTIAEAAAVGLPLMLTR